MHQNRVADGIKCVSPLFLNGGKLFEETNILQGQSQQVGNVHQVGDFIFLEMLFASRADRDNSERSGLSPEAPW